MLRRFRINSCYFDRSREKRVYCTARVLACSCAYNIKSSENWRQALGGNFGKYSHLVQFRRLNQQGLAPAELYLPLCGLEPLGHSGANLRLHVWRKLVLVPIFPHACTGKCIYACIYNMNMCTPSCCRRYVKVQRVVFGFLISRAFKTLVIALLPWWSTVLSFSYIKLK